MGRDSLVAQTVESACSTGDQVRHPVWENPLEKEMATHSSILAWKIPWMEKPGRLGKIVASGLTEFIPFVCTPAIWGHILFLDCLNLIPCPP